MSTFSLFYILLFLPVLSSCLIISHPILIYLIFFPILIIYFHPFLSHPDLSYFLFYPILMYLISILYYRIIFSILSIYPILSYPILLNTILSFLSSSFILFSQFMIAINSGVKYVVTEDWLYDSVAKKKVRTST